jgi:hypothetical protein
VHTYENQACPQPDALPHLCSPYTTPTSSTRQCLHGPRWAAPPPLAEQVSTAACNVVLQCESSDEGRTEMLAEILLEQANDAVEAALEAEQLAHEAQKSIEQSEKAGRRRRGSGREGTHVGVKQAGKVTGVEKKISDFEDGERAVVAAVEGEMAMMRCEWWFDRQMRCVRRQMK